MRRKQPTTREGRKIESAARLARVAELDKRGHTIAEIAAELGESDTAVGYYLRKCIAVYRERVIQDRDELVARQVARLDLVIREAWGAWELSKRDAEQTREECELRMAFKKIVDDDGFEKAVPIGERLDLVKRVTVVDFSCPGNEYLTTIKACVVEQCKLLGLVDEPPKFSTNIPVVSFSVGQVAPRQVEMRELPDQPDGQRVTIEVGDAKPAETVEVLG